MPSIYIEFLLRLHFPTPSHSSENGCPLCCSGRPTGRHSPTPNFWIETLAIALTFRRIQRTLPIRSNLIHNFIRHAKSSHSIRIKMFMSFASAHYRAAVRATVCYHDEIRWIWTVEELACRAHILRHGKCCSQRHRNDAACDGARGRDATGSVIV